MAMALSSGTLVEDQKFDPAAGAASVGWLDGPTGGSRWQSSNYINNHSYHPRNPVDNSAPFSPPKQARGVIPVPRIPKPATPPPPPRFPGPHGRPRPIIPEFPSSPDPPRSPKSPKSPKSSDRPESPETGGDGPSSTSDQENPLPRPTSNNFGGSGSNFRSDRQVTSVGNTLNLQHAVLMLALMATGAMAAA
ncbi:hypothetical protein CIHG_08744 [Coccidioides immitis H538.4]|uniref:Uncharacterized protein n=1 Tax=Coccidioides immitis H538.4 TaxID=396776 RepID=A0A0J8USW1_COCIT|nr:hypothetical protein CIHG_08744 [Coccidioides immitis H538.4]